MKDMEVVFMDINEGLNPGKLNRIKKKLEVDMRQMKSRSGTDSEKLNRMIIARDALDEIATNPDILNIRVSGVNNKFLNMLRQEKISLRTEVLKSEPDLETIASKYLRIKSLMRLTQDRSTYDTQQAAQIKENRYYIMRPVFPSSERSTDLQAMYGNALELKGEDKESYEAARRYVTEGNLFDNIRAKQKRIAKGSGERMKKPGEKGYPKHLEKIAKEAETMNEQRYIHLDEAIATSKARNMLRKLELQLRAEILKSEPDLEKINKLKLKMDAVKYTSNPKNTDGRVSDEETKEDKEPVKVKKKENKEKDVVNEALALPKKSEEKNRFISRFMSDELAKKEFPENKQRVAVAYSQWRRKNKKLREDTFKVSLVNQGGAPSTGTVEADTEDEAITKTIDTFDVDVDNIESVEKLEEASRNDPHVIKGKYIRLDNGKIIEPERDYWDDYVEPEHEKPVKAEPKPEVKKDVNSSFKVNFGSGLKPLNEAKQRHPMLIKYGVEGFNKPKRTPSHKTKSHLVVAKKGDDVKVVRFGAQGVKGSPKKDGESEAYRKRRLGFVARHKAQNPQGMKDKFSPLYWANKIKW